jgi:Na+-driven multidrug efflux pump
MAAIFVIITQVLTGLLDISNQMIGTLIAWTLFDVPLLFLLATFNFLVSLLNELGLVGSEENDTPPISPQ